MRLAFGWLTRLVAPRHPQSEDSIRTGRPGVRTSSVVVIAVGLALGFALSAAASERPRYDVPTGYHKCREVAAWNGFFRWVSVRYTTCRRAQRFLRAYATTAERGPMPRRVRGFRCAIRYWRNEEGDVYASRHRCARGRAIIRFYGMV